MHGFTIPGCRWCPAGVYLTFMLYMLHKDDEPGWAFDIILDTLTPEALPFLYWLHPSQNLLQDAHDVQKTKVSDVAHGPQ